MLSYFADPDIVGKILTFEHRRDSGENVKIYLAEGDSWFSFGGLTSNLLMALDNDNVLIVSCASPGDTMREMSDIGNEPLHMLLHPHMGIKWDGVLLSAGGNDLLGDIGQVLVFNSLNRELLKIVLDGIEAGYKRIIASVRRFHDCPIHAHTYDYPVSDLGGWFRAGPWMGKRLLAAGIPEHLHRAIIIEIIDTLSDRLHEIDGLTIHDTRGTLDPGRWRCIGWQKHWRNEIHPTVSGYSALAAKWKL